MASKSKQWWVDQASAAIPELLAEEKAVTWPELVARLGERQPSRGQQSFNPHILMDARRELGRRGLLEDFQHTIRGGGSVRMLTLPRHIRGNKRQVTDAMGQKGLASARYSAWSQIARVKRSPIGAGLEDALTLAIQEATQLGGGIGYSFLGRGATKDVAEVEDVVLDGPVDNAAYLHDMQQGLRASKAYLVVFEAKNLRDWLYPSSVANYQLLDKCAYLSAHLPGVPIIPVLCARRIHHLTYTFAKAAGFFAVETHRQYLADTVDEAGVRLVQDRLGFDLEILGDTAPPVLVKRLTVQLPTQAEAVARRWRETYVEAAPFYKILRQENLRTWQRGDYYRRLQSEIAGDELQPDEDHVPEYD